MSNTVPLPTTLPTVSQHSNYLQYNKNTSTLLRWIITTASSHLTPAAFPKPKSGNSKNKKKASTAARRSEAKTFSPEVTTAELVYLSQVIAAANQEVPTIIHTLFEEVIRARKAAYDFWCDVCNEHPDKESIQKSNEGHLAFIDALTSAFEALGGLTWRKDREEGQQARREAREADRMKALADRVRTHGSLEFENKFAGLEVPAVSCQDEAELEELAKETPSLTGDTSTTNVAAAMSQENERLKTNGKRGRILVQPLEKYKIKSNEESYFAVCFFLKDYLKLSRYIHDIWQQVASDKLHCAVAGALSNLATGMIKSLEYDLAMDYPGCNHFRAIVRHIIREGFSDSTGHGESSTELLGSGEVGSRQRADVELAEEQLLVSTELDLINFIEDYRKSRTGKPSSTYENLNWNPNFSDRRTTMSDASPQELRKWKSDFTISWLYDLVNTYAAARLRCNKPRMKKPETLDWKVDKDSSNWTRRQLWGPMDFAYDITLLSMKKPKDEIIGEIKPHHVFQVQIIIDSMLTMNRWKMQSSPPVECRESTTSSLAWDIGNSHLRATESLRADWCRSTRHLLSKIDAVYEQNGNQGIWAAVLSYLPSRIHDVLTLGRTSLAEQDTGPISMFSRSSKNGLWLYSPYLYGTGMVEMLNVTYDLGAHYWDYSGIMIAKLHLYNLLLENGHISRPIEFLENMIEVFQEDIFGTHRPRLKDQQGKNFTAAWARAIGIKTEFLRGLNGYSNGSRRYKQGIHKEPTFRSRDNSTDNGKFRKQGKLLALGQAGWIASRIDAKNFPSLATAPQDAVGFLEAIKNDVVNDITGSFPTAYLNFNAIMHIILLVYQALGMSTNLTPFDEAQIENSDMDQHPGLELVDKIMSLALYSDPVTTQDRLGTRLNSPVLAIMGRTMEAFWTRHFTENLGLCFYSSRLPEQRQDASNGRPLGEMTARGGVVDKKEMSMSEMLEPELYDESKQEEKNAEAGNGTKTS